MIRRPPRSTLSSSSAASDVYKRQRTCQAAHSMLLRSSVVSDPGAGSPGARDEMKERLAAPLSFHRHFESAAGAWPPPRRRRAAAAPSLPSPISDRLRRAPAMARGQRDRGGCGVRQLVIDNPVINSAFLEPGKHFKFTDDGITDEIVEARRPSAYFIPVAQPKKKGKQLELGTEWTDDRCRENDYINEVRAAVGDWRRRGYPGVTRTTRGLLEYWQRRDRDRRLFFCQIEAVAVAPLPVL